MALIDELAQVGIVGCGQVGSALGILLGRQPWIARLSFFDRSPEASRRAAELSGGGEVPSSLAELVAEASLLLICVPDDALPKLADELENCGKSLARKLICHTSGAVPSAVLQRLSAQETRIASVHPLQTFPEPQQAADNFAGTYCAIESDNDEAVAVMTELIERLEGHPWRLNAASKALYHAAACTACNYLTVLLNLALKMFKAAGLEESQALLAMTPLVEATVRKNLQDGPAGSLTGPVARGDVGVVAEHLAALKDVDAELAELYQQLGIFAAELAHRQETINPEQLEELRALLKRSKPTH